MTRRHEIEEHLSSMNDIKDIMNAMKNLSFMETRKLVRFLASQQRVVDSIRAAARDFLGAYPQFAAPPAAACSVNILIGAERGFCGDFNEKLMTGCNDHLQRQAAPNPKLVAVGAKLFNNLEGHPLLAAALEGPSVGQEVDGVLGRLVQVLSSMSKEYGSASVTVFHHRHETEKIRITSLLPPFLEPEIKPLPGYPPLLHVPPEAFYERLVDHYLFAALHEMFYTSLMAEHLRRILHLEAAVDRLEEKTAELGRKRNFLRQEEITEEIEEILLSTGAMGYH